MAYSQNFPAQRPVFQFNADAGRVSPNMAFSRASTGTYFGTEKVLSSENLLPYSENSGLWSQSGLLSRTGSQTDPAGGSTGFTLRENSSAGFHRIYQNVAATGDLAFTVYAKQNSGTRYLTLTLSNANNDWVGATFDLAGGAAATSSGSSSSYSSLSATQAASGSSYYKCTIKATGSITGVVASLSDTTSAPSGTYGLPSYTADGSSSIDVSFSSLSTTGATDYSFTNGQIARSYQTKLQTAASGAARFEHSATDGQSMGVLVESQATNKATYSEDFSNGVYTYIRSSLDSNVGVAPDGTLTADMLREDSTASNSHFVSAATATGLSVGSTQFTVSVFVKAAGRNKFRMFDNNQVTPGTTVFDLSNGTVESGSGAIESCSNGWFRCSITPTCDYSATSTVYIQLHDGSGTSYTGNSYSGILLWGYQLETGQTYSSSYISTSGASATRAADSLSVATADIGYTGGPVSVVGEFSLNTDAISSSATVVQLTSTGGNDRAYIYQDQSNERLYGVIQSDGGYPASVDLLGAAAVSGTNYKFAFSANTNDYKAVVNNGTVHTDTDMQLPNEFDKLAIGYNFHGGAGQINGHYKRLAIYANDMTSTNVSALTS